MRPRYGSCGSSPWPGASRESLRIRSVFQKEAVYRWEGNRRPAKYRLEEGKSTEWAKGWRRTAAEGRHGEEAKD